MKILVVDDEKLLVKGVKFNLENEGYEVTAAYDGAAAVELAKKENFDLIVMDVMMPGLSGSEACMQIREFSDVPIIMLTARSEDSDKLMGFACGADDYVTKPFSLEEVVARIRAILRRTQQQVEDDPIIRVGDLEINEDSHDVSRAGQPIDLSPTEYKLLRYLMDNEGRVLSKAQILDHVWQYDWGGDAAIVESYISYLRKKVDGIVIEDENGDKHKVTPLIETKRGIGYMIRAPKN